MFRKRGVPWGLLPSALRSVILGILLSLFLVTLFQSTASAGYLNLTWNAPSTNTDGSSLTDLAGYRVYSGTSSISCPGSVFQQVPSSNPSPSPGTVVSYSLTGLTTGTHPLHLQRETLAARGVARAIDLPRLGDGAWVRVAGAVICRQRPGTAAGFLFLTLEDETGLVNVIVRPDLFRREREVLVSGPLLEVDGVLQAQDGLSVRAQAVRQVQLALPVTPARHFR